MAFDKEADFEQARVLHNNWQCQLFEPTVGFAQFAFIHLSGYVIIIGNANYLNQMWSFAQFAFIHLSGYVINNYTFLFAISAD
jgi:hypothetical protein